MTQHEKLLRRVLSRFADANIEFEELRSLLLSLGFRERVKGSHHIFRRAGVEEMLTLQPEGAKAKRYQVKQVREIILKYRLDEG